MFRALDVTEVTPRKGSTITNAINEAKQLAKLTGQVISFDFNGVSFLIDTNSSVTDLVRIYNKRVSKAA